MSENCVAPNYPDAYSHEREHCKEPVALSPRYANWARNTAVQCDPFIPAAASSPPSITLGASPSKSPVRERLLYLAPGSTMPKSKVNINLCAVEGQWEAGFPQLLLYSSDTVWRESVGSLTLLFRRSPPPAV